MLPATTWEVVEDICGAEHLYPVRKAAAFASREVVWLVSAVGREG